MKEELQGEGTHTYGCDKPGCYWCKVIEPEKYIPITAKPKCVPNKRGAAASVWTKEERSFLQENWFILNKYQLSRALGKSESAIYKKSKELNLGRKNCVHELAPVFFKEVSIVDNFGGWY